MRQLPVVFTYKKLIISLLLTLNYIKTNIYVVFIFLKNTSLPIHNTKIIFYIAFLKNLFLTCEGQQTFHIYLLKNPKKTCFCGASNLSVPTFFLNKCDILPNICPYLTEHISPCRVFVVCTYSALIKL